MGANVDQLLPEAIKHHKAGNLAEAEGIYRQILAAQPRHGEVLDLLGVLMRQRGEPALATETIRRAIEADANSPAAHTHLGDALFDQGKLEDAIAAYERAARLAPSWAEVQGALGNALKTAKYFERAIVAYRKAIALDPKLADAHNNLGEVFYEQKKWPEAIEAYSRAIVLRPDFAEAYNNIGNALGEQGEFDYAIAAYRKAIHFHPDYADAYSNLGLAHKSRGEIEQAVAAYGKAVELKPDLVAALSNLATILREQGKLDEAAAAFGKAVRIAPDFSEAHNNLGNALKDQGKLKEAIASYDRAIALKPDDPVPLSNRICAMHFHPDYDSRAIYEQARLWNERHAAPLAKLIRPHENDRSAERRLRVGYVSPDFREHPIGRFVLPLIERHDREQFEIYCYSDVMKHDAITDQMAAHADQWRSVANLSDEETAELIRNDRIDILIDLSMHMARNRLLVFARKPAPVQATWLAYCSTTGLSAIDYRLTDPYLDPPNEGGEYYSEKSVRLARTNWCYQPSVAAAVSPLPAVRAGHITFGCLNNFCKVTPDTIRTWCEILRGAAGSRLILHANQGSHRALVREILAAELIDPDRLSFVGFMSAREYFQRYCEIDIALDPFPYVGGTTTCDALWMGVPVISLAGQSAYSRPGLSMLSNVGLSRFVTFSKDDYVATAQRLGGQIQDLMDLRASFRSRMLGSPLMDSLAYARDVEQALRTMWREYVASRRLTALGK